LTVRASYEELTDEDLMLHAQRGHLKAFEVLARRHQVKLVNFLNKYVGDLATAEDLCQQALLKIYYLRNKFKGRGKFTSWMYAISANMAKDHLRRVKRRPTISLDTPIGEDSTIIDFFKSDEKTSSELLEDREMEKVVRLAVDSLPDHQRMVIILSHYENLNYDEIARILNCSKGTVKSRVFRAKARLKELLTDYFLGKETGAKNELRTDKKDADGLSG